MMRIYEFSFTVWDMGGKTSEMWKASLEQRSGKVRRAGEDELVCDHMLVFTTAPQVP